MAASNPPSHDLLHPDRLLALARDLLDRESRALADLKEQIDATALAEVLALILACQGKVMVTGAGTSSSIARRTAHLLTCAGAPSVFLDAGQAQHGYSAAVTGQDVVMAFSRGGETDEVNSLLRIVRQRGAKVVSILENSESTMASLSDLLLRVAVAPENDAFGPIPLASTLAHAAFADVLCAAVLTARGFDPGEFAAVHPGGAVGKRLRSTGE